MCTASMHICIYTPNKLNRLRTGVEHFNADMWRLSKSPAYNCRADQQTANHIIMECHLYGPPNGLHCDGLIDVDAVAATHEWLLSKSPEIYFFWSFGFTRKKKKKMHMSMNFQTKRFLTSRLLLPSYTFAIIVILDLTPYLLR